MKRLLERSYQGLAAALSGMAVCAFVPWGTVPVASLKGQTKVRLRVGSADCKKGRIFSTELALTPEQQEKGLSNRKRRLKHDEAMIFVFDPPRDAQFWMIETYIPLSIGFFDAKGAMVRHHEMPVEKDPKHPIGRYGAGQPVSAAIEAAPNTLAPKAGEKLGDLHLCIEKK